MPHPLDRPAASLDGGILMTMHRFSQGGGDRVGVILANGFARAGVPTEIALLRNCGEGEAALLDLVDPAVSLSCAGRPLTRHLELVRGLGFVQRRIAAARPALVFASSNNMGLVTGLAARRLGPDRPAFAMKVTNPVVRPHDDWPLRRTYRHFLYRFVFGNFDRIITISDAEQATLTAAYPALADRFATAPNAYIDDAMLAEMAPQTDPTRPHLLTTARMMPQKRLDRMLRAFARVTTPGTHLTILGDGPERPMLEKLTHQLGIAGRVSMPGFQDDVLPWLRRADLFLLSSDYEGLPAALLEALACGVPVVTTDCFDGARTLLASAPGCAVVPREDETAFARAIEIALAAPSLPDALRDIARPYTIDASVAAHLDLLRPVGFARQKASR